MYSCIHICIHVYVHTHASPMHSMYMHIHRPPLIGSVHPYRAPHMSTYMTPLSLSTPEAVMQQKHAHGKEHACNTPRLAWCKYRHTHSASCTREHGQEHHIYSCIASHTRTHTVSCNVIVASFSCLSTHTQSHAHHTSIYVYMHVFGRTTLIND